MKDKGQALIEFIIILPIVLLLLVGMIDFGKIIYQKYQLENNLDLVVDLYNNGKKSKINEYIKNEKLSISYNQKNDLLTITLSKKVDIFTPGLNIVLENPYLIKVNRTIYEQ